MKITRSLFACLTLFGLALSAQGKEYKDTVYTQAKDRIIISYEVQNSEGKAVVRFNSIQKKLSSASQGKYKDLDKVAVMFFDRVAVSDIKIENMTPQAFIVPAGATYESSDEGYFIMQDNPAITFRLKTQDKVTLSLPIYLAYHDKKSRYKLFAKADGLQIKLNATNTAQGAGGNSRKSSTGNPKSNAHAGEPRAANADELVETFTTEEEDGGQNEQSLKVLGLRRDIMAMIDQLNEEGELSATDQEEMGYLIQDLRKLKYEVTDEEVLAMIEETLDAYRRAQKGQEASAAASAAAAQQAAEEKAKAEAAAAKAEQDSIAAVQAQKDEESKQQTIWMTIAGIGLAVLGYVGNMIFKAYQQKKQQLSMENMTKKMQMEAQKKAAAATQEAMKAAEAKAKEAAQNAAQNMQQSGQPAQPAATVTEPTPAAPAGQAVASATPAAQPAAPVAPGQPVAPATQSAPTAPVPPTTPAAPSAPVSAPNAAEVAAAGMSTDPSKRPVRRKFSDLVGASPAADGNKSAGNTANAAPQPQPQRTIGNYKVAPRRPRPRTGENQ